MYVRRKLQNIFAAGSFSLKRRLLLIATMLAGANLVIWFFIFGAARQFPIFPSLAIIAYGLGLRHAVDADHIAAIDNTTRKLMNEGQRPAGVGLFFSLGHSFVVILLSILVAVSVSFVQLYLPELQRVGGVVGAVVSALFLLIIGGINLVIFFQTLARWRSLTKSSAASSGKVNAFGSGPGLMTRILKPFLSIVRKSWHMLLIGFLFGLGFDTASEVGLLSISALAGESRMPLRVVVLIPLAFAAGMTLVDTLDGVLMLGAYGWAYLDPLRKLYYNLNITFISVLVAVVVGGVGALQIISKQAGWEGGIWVAINRIQFGSLGYFIIGIFVASWLLSLVFFRFARRAFFSSR